jgi:NTP pyrophosphatase (non-canonical NTP hydrolase)
MAKEIHALAILKGWWENPPSFLEVVALCHSELSEAVEEYRNHKPNIYYDCGIDEHDDDCICEPEDTGCGSSCEGCEVKGNKPEGIGTELADCIIRILDYCAYAGIDIDEIIRLKHEYNKTRPYKHGGKRI